nr:MAG TPA: hypothetical protein [Caudoviricetes sp.]
MPFYLISLLKNKLITTNFPQLLNCGLSLI